MNIKMWHRCLFVPAIVIVMLGCEEQQIVYNDDYEQPPEPDYALRELLGVRTLRGSFEMPEGMRSYRRGLIFIEEGKVTGSNGWVVGDGAHTFHADGKTEYAKTIQVEYMNWKNDGDWQGFFRDIPSIAWSNPKVNKDFWERFESDALQSKGGGNLRQARFGEYQILAAWHGSKRIGATGNLESLLNSMDYLALLAVKFSPREAQEVQKAGWSKPSNEALQRILDERLR